MNRLRTLIVEDEPVTARNLSHLLQSINNGIEINAMLTSVQEAVEWFKENDNYDLIFMDIRLADGLSFDIFKQATITKPVIFVTAYNDYAIEAFKNNGIDYILKPFDEREVERALVKFESLVGINKKESSELPVLQLIKQISNPKAYKKSFLVHYRDRLIPIETAKISWFYTANEIVYAHTVDARQFVIDFTMEQLEQQLDKSIFFRANRQFIVNRKEITEIEFYFNGRLSVKVKPAPPESIIISKARVPEFKSWMND